MYKDDMTDTINAMNRLNKLNTNPSSDPVHSPSHYMNPSGVETRDIIRDLLGAKGFNAYCVGNAIKYLSRYERKGNPIQDLKKAQEYIYMIIIKEEKS